MYAESNNDGTDPNCWSPPSSTFQNLFTTENIPGGGRSAYPYVRKIGSTYYLFASNGTAGTALYYATSSTGLPNSFTWNSSAIVTNTQITAAAQPSSTVNVSGTTVTRTAGANFNPAGNYPGLAIKINGTNYTVVSVASTSSLTIDTSLTLTAATAVMQGQSCTSLVNSAAVLNGSTWMLDVECSGYGFWAYGSSLASLTVIPFGGQLNYPMQNGDLLVTAGGTLLNTYMASAFGTGESRGMTIAASGSDPTVLGNWTLFPMPIMTAAGSSSQGSVSDGYLSIETQLSPPVGTYGYGIQYCYTWNQAAVYCMGSNQTVDQAIAAWSGTAGQTEASARRMFAYTFTAGVSQMPGTNNAGPGYALPVGAALYGQNAVAHGSWDRYIIPDPLGYVGMDPDNLGVRFGGGNGGIMLAGSDQFSMRTSFGAKVHWARLGTNLFGLHADNGAGYWFQNWDSNTGYTCFGSNCGGSRPGYDADFYGNMALESGYSFFLLGTGGAGKYVKQSTLNGAISVGTIPSSDILAATPATWTANATTQTVTGAVDQSYITQNSTATTIANITGCTAGGSGSIKVNDNFTSFSNSAGNLQFPNSSGSNIVKISPGDTVNFECFGGGPVNLWGFAGDGLAAVATSGSASDLGSGTLANARLAGSGATTVNGTSCALGGTCTITTGGTIASTSNLLKGDGAGNAISLGTPAACSSGQYATGIAATGAATCAQVDYSQLSGSAPVTYFNTAYQPFGGPNYSSSTLTPTANVPRFFQVTIPVGMAITNWSGYNYPSGTSNHYSFALYSSAGALVVSTSSVTASASSVAFNATTAATNVAPGTYYMAVTCDTAACQFFPALGDGSHYPDMVNQGESSSTYRAFTLSATYNTSYSAGTTTWPSSIAGATRTALGNSSANYIPYLIWH
jgi:hypothetical protein